MKWFTQRLAARLDEASYRTFQQELLHNPEKGRVMPGCGGLRKVRARDQSRGQGKSGGVRIIYLYIPQACRIDLFDVYGKDEKGDLTPQEKKILAGMVDQVRQEAIRAYQRRRGTR